MPAIRRSGRTEVGIKRCSSVDALLLTIICGSMLSLQQLRTLDGRGCPVESERCCPFEVLQNVRSADAPRWTMMIHEDYWGEQGSIYVSPGPLASQNYFCR